MSDDDTEIRPTAEPVEGVGVQPDLFQVTVKGTGVELTRQVDQATALNVIATVLSGPTSTSTPPTYIQHIPVTPAQQPTWATESAADEVAGLDPYTTIGEYIDECGATQFSAKITAIGNFLELKLGQPSFTREEVKSQFRPAGETQPANFSRDFADAIAQRWIAEDPEAKGQYFVTKTGKAAILAKFDRSSRKSTSARRRKPTAKSVSGEPNADGYGSQDLDTE